MSIRITYEKTNPIPGNLIEKNVYEKLFIKILKLDKHPEEEEAVLRLGVPTPGLKEQKPVVSL